MLRVYFLNIFKVRPPLQCYSTALVVSGMAGSMFAIHCESRMFKGSTVKNV